MVEVVAASAARGRGIGGDRQVRRRSGSEVGEFPRGDLTEVAPAAGRRGVAPPGVERADDADVRCGDRPVVGHGDRPGGARTAGDRVVGILDHLDRDVRNPRRDRERPHVGVERVATRVLVLGLERQLTAGEIAFRADVEPDVDLFARRQLGKLRQLVGRPGQHLTGLRRGGDPNGLPGSPPVRAVPRIAGVRDPIRQGDVGDDVVGGADSGALDGDIGPRGGTDVDGGRAERGRDHLRTGDEHRRAVGPRGLAVGAVAAPRHRDVVGQSGAIDQFGGNGDRLELSRRHVVEQERRAVDCVAEVILVGGDGRAGRVRVGFIEEQAAAEDVVDPHVVRRAVAGVVHDDRPGDVLLGGVEYLR